MKDFWSEDDSVSELDMLEEANETEAIGAEIDALPVNYVDDLEEEELREISEESAFDLDDEESTVVYNARLRLDQAKLYEMLINHDLFGDTHASEQAISNVQNELKQFIVKRLEILLGMRQLKPVPEKISRIEYDDRFNDIEVDFLKQLAYKGTKGRSIEEIEIVRPRESKIRPVTYNVNKLKPLRTLSSKSVEKAPIRTKKPIIAKKEEEEEEEPLRKNKKVVKKKTSTPDKKANVKSGGRDRSLTPKEVEEIALQDIENMKGRDWSKMTSKEKAKEIAKVNNKHSRKQVTGAMPIPDFSQLQMKYMTEQQQRSMSTDSKYKMDAIIASAITAQKSQE